MRNDSIQQLLAKRQAGTLTDCELQELNRLTHKDEVVAAAEQAATGITHRRRLIVSAVAVVAVAIGTVGIALLVPKQEVPMVAQQQALPQPVAVEEVPQTVEAPATPVAPAAAKTTVAPKPAVAQAQPVKSVPQAVETRHADPTVMCNNQCEADSVISDIWKFLTA